MYDRAIGHGRQVVVATLPRWNTSLIPSGDGLAQLTDAEREQLEAFLAQRRVDTEESNSRYTTVSASSWLAMLTKSPKEGQQLQPEQAEAIRQGMGEVAKPLHKAGYAKPKATRKIKPAPTPPVLPQEVAAGESSAPSAEHVRKPHAVEVKISATPENSQPE